MTYAILQETLLNRFEVLSSTDSQLLCISLPPIPPYVLIVIV